MKRTLSIIIVIILAIAMIATLLPAFVTGTN